MQTLLTPDAEQIKRWLQQANIQHYICDQCHGLHLSELQGRDGVLDARLFVEDDGLLMTTELELRPSALFVVQSELSRLNMQYPSLKVFLDVNDDTLPRLVACDLLLTRQGISFQQFIHFIQATLDSTVQVLDEASQGHWLMDADEPQERGHGHLH